MNRLSLQCAVLGVTLISGCSSLGVKPWQRDVLAREEMQLNSDPLDAAIDDHMYFSKEASSGGRSFAGGGCGCN
jgi:outer membrane murein-binding lipoprotein Lpp